MESLTVKKFNELKIISFLRKYEDRRKSKEKIKQNGNRETKKSSK
jgi:hypothetical protein